MISKGTDAAIYHLESALRLMQYINRFLASFITMLPMICITNMQGNNSTYGVGISGGWQALRPHRFVV
jgi:hypothetical protein